jgi:CRP-like cAMP-binding protein
VNIEGQELRRNLIEALSQSSLLRFIGQHSPYSLELRDMLEASEVVTFKAGRVIIREGNKSDRMYFITHGQVEVLKGDKVLCTLGRIGDVFGEFGVISGELRSASVVAKNEVTCLATNPVLAGQLNHHEDSLFTHLMQQALNRLLLGRLMVASDELTEAKKDLAHAEKHIKVLQKQNTGLEKENRSLQAQVGPGLRGTRADNPDEKESTSRKR